MFDKMQTDNHNLVKDVTTNEKYILRKMALKFQFPKFNIYAKWHFIYVLLKNLNPEGVKRSEEAMRQFWNK